MNTHKPTPVQPHGDCLPLTPSVRSEMSLRHHEQVWTIYRSFRRPMANEDLARLVVCWNEIVTKYAKR